MSNPIPVVARPALIPAVFRVAQGATPIVARAGAGATISFSLSQAADASIAIAKATAGKRRGKACVKPTRKLRHASGCTLWKTLGTLTRKGLSTGGIHIPFTGRIGIKPLRPGQYRAAITAKATGRSSRLPARASLYRCPYRARP